MYPKNCVNLVKPSIIDLDKTFRSAVIIEQNFRVAQKPQRAK